MLSFIEQDITKKKIMKLLDFLPTVIISLVLVVFVCVIGYYLLNGLKNSK